jgi:MFS family permease
MEKKQNKPKTISHLFSDGERKSILKQYLIFMGIIEVCILFFCWFYQMGTHDYDRFGPVDIPFPWRIYFLMAFLIPVVITFLVGIFLVAFNKYLADHDSKIISGDKQTAIARSKFESVIQTLLNLPFLLSLFLVGIGAGVIYRIDDIVDYLQRLGEQSVQFLLILICTTLGIGTLFGLTWMIFTYKLKKKSMEYEFKTHVMDKFGIAVLENNTMITRAGQLITHENSSSNPLKDVKQLTQSQDLDRSA